MQARHHRSSLSGGGRISPDGSLRTHHGGGGGGGGFYNSDFRTSFNRNSFGRGPPPPPPPPPLHKTNRRNGNGDVFAEAGKLAAEYLVSQGVLAPNVLQQKFLDARNSSRRRYASDDYNSAPAGSRNYTRPRTRPDSFAPSPGGGAWWSEKPTTNFTDDMESEDDLVARQQYHYEHHHQGGAAAAGFDAPRGQTLNELPSQNHLSVVNSEIQFQKSYEFPDEASVPNVTASSTVVSETDHQISNTPDDVKVSDAETQVDKQMEKQDAVQEDLSSMEGDNGVARNGDNLLQTSSFGNMPVEASSSLVINESKDEPVETAEEINTREIPPPDGTQVSNQEAPFQDSAADNVAVLDSAYAAMDKGESPRLETLPDTSVMYEHASGQGLSQLGKSSPIKDRGEKRAAESHDIQEATKKPREMPSVMVGSHQYLTHHTSFTGDLSHSHNKSTAPDAQVIEIPEDERLLDADFFPQAGEEPDIEFREEKQLFPSSFKICDLNLMEASDISETRDSDPLLNLPSTFELKKQVPVDVDLTISNSCNRSDDYDKNSTDNQEAMAIEVEDDFTEEEKVFHVSETKNANVNSNVESFQNHMESTGDQTDAQDGYGLMISELLGADIPNCSSVSEEITGLPTEMGLHNGAGILGDDDPIYLSLGEIPISFLGVWEQQPNQQYEKPF